jgi:hypothetical protein
MFIKRSFWYFSLEKYITDAEYDLLPERLKKRYKRLSVDGPLAKATFVPPPVVLKQRAVGPSEVSGPVVRSTFIDEPVVDEEEDISIDEPIITGPSLLDLIYTETPVVIEEPVYVDNTPVEQFGGFEGGNGGGAGAGGSWDDNASVVDDTASYTQDDSPSYDYNSDNDVNDTSQDYSSDNTDYSNNDF